ncbi:hypothetical protein HNQ59_001435 [Chitinivorax tropicus]|uniref:Cytochrome c oxidase subunit IV n=1 Tax=Chitinivorax tropicus TaxID=714531 RepID=A0A840MIC0_9PROT|nr:cytochrome C oxidase subunit IV family protein [Chitinivorax tropicus]MBB5018150.1 hypothetical protein [Chitinivorax tropicus]
MQINVATGCWVVLLSLTGAAWWVAEAHLTSPIIMLGLAGATWVKGWLIIDHFMALRRVSWLWRGLVLGWLSSVLLLIAVFY